MATDTSLSSPIPFCVIKDMTDQRGFLFALVFWQKCICDPINLLHTRLGSVTLVQRPGASDAASEKMPVDRDVRYVPTLFFALLFRLRGGSPSPLQPHTRNAGLLSDARRGGYSRGLQALIYLIRFLLLFSRQGKLRLQKWYVTLTEKEKNKITRELVTTILNRGPRMSSFVEWKDMKLVYKRYASLFFCCAIEDQDNELLTLEVVHRLVELLDKYFGNVCELDIIFNFEKAYFILDEFLLGGEVQDTSKESVTMEEYMSKPTF
ncbi:AP-1 complex subunit sigma-3 isoform X3 [Ascaphus truei]|uniref:AP-1 complex subunit sigma-3 isoform X3 n=1 Tax=Ascaphus truei TaxID=8439 RepID=UPI003F5A1054